MANSSTWVNGEGPVHPKFMIVGEAPAKDEISVGRLFVGRTGYELNELIYRRLMVDRNDCYLTNYYKHPIVNKKKLPENETPMFDEILMDEVNQIDPYIIISMGVIATRFFLHSKYDMETLNGMPHIVDGRIVVPCFHPAIIFHDTGRLKSVHDAFDVAKAISNDKYAGVVVTSPTPIRVDYIPVPLSNTLDMCADSGGCLALDTETFFDGSHFMTQVCSVPPYMSYGFHQDIDFHKQLRSAISKPDGPCIVMHNAMFDINVMSHMDNVPTPITNFTDTMIMAFLIQTLPLALKNLVYRLFGHSPQTYTEVVGDLPDLSYLPLQSVLDYACPDPVSTMLVYHQLQSMAYPHMDSVLKRDMDIIPMLMSMMSRGISLNTDYISDLECEFTIHNADTLEKIRSYAWKDFNPGSSPQTSKLLFDTLKLSSRYLKDTKWGKSTNQTALKTVRGQHPVVPLIEDWREVKTIIDKYINVLPTTVSPDGRIHTKLSLIRVKHSGRIASSKPNLMAQPIRSKNGLRIRGGFVAPPGFIFMSLDYSQIEMRLMAHLSQDPIMLKICTGDGDIHTETATRMFNLPESQIDSMKHRYPAKRTGFGIINFISASGLARELMDGGAGEWSTADCEKLLDTWFNIYKGVHRYMMESQAEVKRDHFVTDMWGRMEYIPEFSAHDSNVVSTGVRVSGNQRIQSGAQGIIKEAMVNMSPYVNDLSNRDILYPIIQIHDDLMFEVRVEYLKEVSKTIRHYMEHCVDLSVTLLAEPKVGYRWNELKAYNSDTDIYK